MLRFPEPSRPLQAHRPSLAAAQGPWDERGRSPGDTVLALWLAWVVFVVYGSLVPLDFRPLAPADAWHRLVTSPWFRIGVEGRADWIANGVLYFPVGFLSVALLLRAPRPTPARNVIAMAAGFLFGIALAAAVEFAQTFFPPRTVSLNDLFAESVGTLLGATAALAGTRHLHALLAGLRAGGPRLLRLLGPAYALGYAVLALFPYDVLLGGAEWADKLSGPNVGVLLADSALGSGWVILGAKLALEALGVAPLGAWWASTHAPAQPTPADGVGARWPLALWLGAALGLLIEVAQLALASGVTQGASVLTRAAGFAAGAMALRVGARLGVEGLRAILRRVTVPALLLYLPGLSFLHGWWRAPWTSIGEALRRLAGDVSFVPFYYHYFTTEMQAVVSLVAVAASYAPIGLLGWAWHLRASRAAGLAALLAGVVEAGRLMVPGSHPDPTNVLIAAAAAWSVVRLLQLSTAGWAGGGWKASSPSIAGLHDHPQATIEQPTALDHRPARWLPPALAAIVAAGWLTGFPVEPTWLGIGLLAASALVAWRPVLLFVIVAAALPVLDLAPWSGRRGFDEFDMLVLLGLTIAWARTPRPPHVRPTPETTLALGLLLLGLAVATGRALWPWPTPDPDAFGNPLSPFNALRLAKAAVWAVGLWLLARRLRAAGADPVRAFGTGMVAGLAATVVCIVAERLSFTYLLDFGSDYRIAGPFSAMSLGGAYVECFLAVATPFLLARLLAPVSLLRVVAGAVLLAGASYAVMVTYSRGGYVAMAVGVLVLGVAALLPPGPKARRALAAIALLAVAAAVAYPILQGTFAQSRLQTVAADLQTRERHWSDSLSAMDDGAAATLFGMGLGRYAAINFWQNPAEMRTGGHRLIAGADGGTVLRLGVGYAYFVEQIVPVEPRGHYRLRYRMRSEDAGAVLWVGLCQKWIVASFDCAQATATGNERDPVPPAPGAWKTVTATLVAPEAGPGRLPRPMRLSLVNQGSVAVDVDDVSLVGEDGIDLVRNGGFEAGFDRWTFTSDNHLAWHTKSMPLGIYFEQGLLGLLGFGALLLVGIRHAARGARRGRADGAALLAALCAFVTVGAIDTLVDAPRFLMLWLLLCLLPSALTISAAAPARAAR